MTLDSNAWETFALIALILAAAFFAASEAALISITRVRARGMLERGVNGAAHVVKITDDRNRLLSSVLVGNTAVLLAADSLATYLFIKMGLPHAAIWSTVIMTVAILLFGEILPKTVAVAHAETWAVRLAPAMDRVAWILTPIVRAMLFLTNFMARLFGGASVHGPFVTEEDIRALVNVGAEQRVLEEQEREMIHSIIEFGDTIVREVMKPRPDIVAAPVTSSPRHALDLVVREGYSKLPVYEETIDNVIGVIHDRELLISLANGTLASVPLRALMRPVHVVPETKRVSELLREMQRGKYSLAVVIDEYGGTAGLVTMEDLLEEIVGEIRDEHDEGEEEPIRIISTDEASVDSGANIEDVNARLGTSLPYDEFETIGGYTVGLFGHLPSEGEEVQARENVRIRVERTRGRRILSVRVLTNGKARAEAPVQEQPSSGRA